ncbi:Two-component response regulator [Pseudonocardia sp. Ae168_Ps1]|uniref:sensor domain-containing diguanylate cyclase n=1 Tax=unclassified Pseudonocardia TaxID=2619320 RepID=UPI00094B3D9E|nr:MULTISPECIES: DICT sensory domain-containing protein [unclassified Pseudonocardia]OLL76224.1 Two-component response regulator [Pseudonocardia sp. Ae150A_Ps1]OLL82223.1 Two-component response regulator [Pseudonocardia sp. Ae168_Ps1]OLL83661.1 Two-component response regulator [Pseudonocardia sp. Ae263_Ps1]OLL90298.1 Two-component response regulator [Pseudonocardia sp. Ae356_Ps1]
MRGAGPEPVTVADDAGRPSRTVTTPLLAAVSRAVEDFALAPSRDRPTAVVGLVQRAGYLEPHLGTWARIAERCGGGAVVAVAGEPPEGLPPGLGCVPLADGEPAAREWSVTVLTPRSGATVVAHDLEAVDGSARSLERGRLFTARWSFRHSDAHDELLRLRRELGPRLGPRRTGALDEVLSRVVPIPGTATDHRYDAAADRLARSLSDERRRADLAENRLDAHEPGAERDPRSGLPTRAFLDRWMHGSAPGTLPLGLVLLRVHGLGTVNRLHGFRAESSVLQGVARLLGGHTGATGRPVRVGREEFLLVLPGLDVRTLAGTARRLCESVAGLSSAFPFVPTPSHAVITRTRDRPLPLDALWAALDGAAGTGVTLLRG